MKMKALTMFLLVFLLLLLPPGVGGEGAPASLTGGPMETGNAILVSITDGTIYGQSVAIPGDVNGDGFDDVLVGQPGDDETNFWEGVALLYLGGPAGWSHYVGVNEADAYLLGETYGDWAGFSVAGAGDFNGDGLDDFVVGAPKRYGGDGVVYLFLGRDTWPYLSLADADAIFTGAGGENAGWNVSPAGDLDGDGFDDVVIGAPQYNGAQGRVYVMFGADPPVSRPLANADVILEGEAAGDRAGFSVAGAGDVDGDRYNDLFIGAPYWNGGDGRVYLVTHILLGPFPLTRNLAAADRHYDGITSQYLGWSVDVVSDMNGDGLADLLAGFTTDSGGAYLVLGSPTPKANCTLDTCTDQGYRGIAGSTTGGRVAGVGDVNADGYGDLVIGACGYPNSTGRGRATLIYGEPNPSGVVDLGSDVDTHYTGMNASDLACVAQNGAGDINGDNISDLVFGAPGFDNRRGRAYLVFSDDTEVTAVRYRAWSIYYFARRVGQSGVALTRVGGTSQGTAYVTRHFRGTCDTSYNTNGLLWTVDSQLARDVQLRVTFRYNDRQIADWTEADLKLWYRQRPCGNWMSDDGAILDQVTNHIQSSPVANPHFEYAIAPTPPGPTLLGFAGAATTTPAQIAWPLAGMVLLVSLPVIADWWRKRD